MKKAVLLSVIFLCAFSSFSQVQENQIISEFDTLVADHKYESAYNYLSENQNNISKSAFAINSTDLLLNYFVMSSMHQMFALKDIPVNEHVYNYRGKEGTYKYIMFDPVTVLNEAIEDDNENGELFYWLGFYYYELLSKYNGQWLISNEEIREKSLENYQMAYEKGFSDSSSLGNIGQLHLQNSSFDEALVFLNKAIQAEPDNAAYYHNASVCFLNLNNYEQAVEYAENAISLYNDDFWKADSCFLLGSIYIQTEQFDLAINNFEMGKSLAPGEYKYPDRLIELYLHSDNLEKAKENAMVFFKMFPTNPTVTSMILEHYNYYNKLDRVDDIFIALIDEFQNQDEPLGNLFFYRSIVADGLGEYERSLQYVNDARKLFKEVFNDDHEVFTELNNIEEQVKSKI